MMRKSSANAALNAICYDVRSCADTQTDIKQYLMVKTCIAMDFDFETDRQFSIADDDELDSVLSTVKTSGRNFHEIEFYELKSGPQIIPAENGNVDKYDKFRTAQLN
ncbi:hypothetical protein GQX74_013102 [Glossina fuscipes]|nr:hypothetical protein GQX74_013102 [Glossina fuscipes]